MKVLIKGAGVGGLVAAYQLFLKGADITVSAPLDSFSHSASWYAGGMLAPYCERESAEQIVEDLGRQAMGWWAENLPDLVQHNGTFVLAPQRDQGELNRFAQRTTRHVLVDEAMIAELEPDLAGRFKKALFFAEEADIDPRKALQGLQDKLIQGGAAFIAPLQNEEETEDYDVIIDATGIARLGVDKDLRGVRGEMLLVRCPDVHITRPVRLLHPRIPLYIVPRSDHTFMIGATMIESDYDGPISARSMMELLNAAYTLHPAFAEAEIIETGVGVRPAYADNFPRMTQEGNRHFYINGFYRHGFLLSPEMARRVTDKLCPD
ncbi:glycine oxidase ThiO [Bartonella sp. HY761]|uniref:glycine oxidase ThiO n=1 Tax=Bartonella sp. HY761 TaxID=2979330 RepID=UPI0021FB92CC|nr:glycine oxidase ThiO [Bartonella sp. HY761]UXN05619.1 glycine oxidase ThiO [Bartonella sp. HY761]